MSTVTARAAVQVHPPVLVGYAPIAGEVGQYDLREVALWLIDNGYPENPSDVWGERREDGTTKYLLGGDVHKAALRLTIAAMEGRIYEQPGKAGHDACYPRCEYDPPYRPVPYPRPVTEVTRQRIAIRRRNPFGVIDGDV